MEQKEIIDGNILIAKFMGYMIDNSFPDKNKVYRLGNKIDLDTDFSYHTSWDWFMHAYRKVKDVLSAIERPSKNHVCKGDALEVDIHCSVLCIDIEKAFQAMVIFIKWFNQQ